LNPSSSAISKRCLFDGFFNRHRFKQKPGGIDETHRLFESACVIVADALTAATDSSKCNKTRLECAVADDCLKQRPRYDPVDVGTMSHILVSANRKRTVLLSGMAVVIALVASTAWHVHSSSSIGTDSSTTDQSSGVSVLLGLADSAFHEHRLLAPAGSNMYEFYLSVLELDPHNKQALDRLHTAFEPACQEVEHTISTGDLDEGERELRLLHDYGTLQGVESDNYKVALLGSYLYAQRNLLTRKHEAEALQIQERAAASTN